MQIAEREVARKAEIMKRLDYISRRLGQLDIIRNLPDTEFLSQELINSALDVQSASMIYLTVHVRYASSHFGIASKTRVLLFD